MKIIKVNNCFECPYIGGNLMGMQEDNIYCDKVIMDSYRIRKINNYGIRKIIGTLSDGKANGFHIPEWCPLENDIYKDLPTDLAENHDKYLADEYEGKKYR